MAGMAEAATEAEVSAEDKTFCPREKRRDFRRLLCRLIADGIMKLRGAPEWVRPAILRYGL